MEVEEESSRPRKLVHLENTPAASSNQNDYLNEQWGVVEDSVRALLTSQITNSHAVIKLTRAVNGLISRTPFKVQEKMLGVFERIYQELWQGLTKQANPLTALMAYFATMQSQHKVLFDLLNHHLMLLDPTGPTLQQKANQRLCKMVSASQVGKRVAQELNDMVFRFRTTVEREVMEQLQAQLRMVGSLGLFGTFEKQFLEGSRYYFVRMSSGMARNQDLFIVIDEALRREKLLQSIAKPKESTVYYVEKQLIRQSYPFMLECLPSLMAEAKEKKLKLLWQYSKMVRHSQSQSLEGRFQQIVQGIQKLLSPSQLHQITEYLAHMQAVISTCFGQNKRMAILLHNTVEEVLTGEERTFNLLLSQHIMTDHPTQSHESIFPLLRLVPNKEVFIASLERQFFNWVINSDTYSLAFQEPIIQALKRDCGFALCKKLERMLTDVWKDGRMNYHRHGKMKCRLLSLKDWPKFEHQPIALPSAMADMVSQFEDEFRKEPDNNKELVWVNELGTVELSIHGVECVLSEVETAVVFTLDKLFRPLKADQISQILQTSQQRIVQLLATLTHHSIVVFNEENSTYQLSDTNKTPYHTVRAIKHSKVEEVAVSKRDDSIVVEAWIVKLMKRKKTLPKTDLTKLLYDNLKRFKPSLQEVNSVIERLEVKEFIEVDKVKGIIRYRE